MQNKKRKLRNALISATAFTAVMALSGCSSFHDSNQNAVATSSIPITCNGMELSDSPHATAADTRPASVASTPSSLAYASAEDSVAPPSPTPKNINVYGEFDGKTRATNQTPAQANFQQHTFVDEGFDGEVSVDPT